MLMKNLQMLFAEMGEKLTHSEISTVVPLKLFLPFDVGGFCVYVRQEDCREVAQTKKKRTCYRNTEKRN